MKLHLLAAVAAFAISGPVLAQTAPAAPAAAAPAAPAPVAPINAAVLVLDGERLVIESAVGKDMTSKLQAVATQIQNEVRTERTPLQAEITAVQAAIGNQTAAQVRANAELRTRVENLDRRLAEQERRDQRRQRELMATDEQARGELNRLVTPVIQEVVQARGGQILLERGAVAYAVGGVDITSDVVARLDQRVRALTVTRVVLPDQPAPGAQPAAAAPAPAARPAPAATTPPRPAPAVTTPPPRR
jgi:Skp family chaperone for outer membrane proteins